MFLFQTGAIKTFFQKIEKVFSCVFLFQTGAIKTQNVLTEYSAHLRFYSKLVRLKPFAASIAVIAMPRFLFQTGAIKTNAICRNYVNISTVSIPNWCD